MDTWKRFDCICQAMAAPSFYPHPVRCLRRVDTHISSVFLTGQWAYKLKKPVYLDFLDFRRLADRRKYCEREVRLNRRLSQGIYENVIRIIEVGKGQFALEGRGKVVEYAVKMKQLPEDTGLKGLLLKDRIRRRNMIKLGEKMAGFYEKSKRGPLIDGYGQRHIIAFNMEENFRQLAAFIGDMLDKDKWEFLLQVSRSFLEHHYRLFDKRVETGRICDGHGDLRIDHIYFFEGLQIIDCIEFNDRFRYGDAVVDLAFLYMDLEHLGYKKWGRAFLEAYVEKADDPGLYALIDFYATYRSLVRLKVTALQCENANGTKKKALIDEAKRYAHQAFQYAIQFSRPTLWVVCGLPGTGKSSLAHMLSNTLFIKLFQSDHVRKHSHSNSEESVLPFGKGLYRPGMRQRVYAKLFALAQETLKKGRSVILDATFSRRKWREAAQRLGEDLDANLIFVECFCRDKTIRARLKGRKGSSGLSDARLEHLPQMALDFEPIVEFCDEIHLRIDTDKPLGHALAEVLSAGFACKSCQVKRLLRIKMA